MDNVSIAVILTNNLATFTQRNMPFGRSLCKNVRFQVSEIVEEVEKSWQSDLRNVILGKAKALHQSTGVLALFSSFFSSALTVCWLVSVEFVNASEIWKLSGALASLRREGSTNGL
jgi:hypothetical protein